MKLDVYGSKASGYPAHGSYEPGVDRGLISCPFCGERQNSSDGAEEGITVTNTHTPYYTAQCRTCGAEINGESFGKRKARSKAEAVRQHQKAFASAIATWNRRVA